MSAGKLYDDVIRNHNNHPYHFEKSSECSNLVQAYNFICGDKFDLCLTLEGSRISKVQFHGFGCAVSKASTSILAKQLEGKTKTEARQICNQFLRLLKNELGKDETLFSAEFQSFQVVQEIPARYDCAALAWLEVEKFLAI
jgi:nitrogen fixation NifU-like protein